MAETNPFLYGSLALDEAFTDREREVAELRSDLLNGQDVVILAPRRYGKTSLVWRVQQELLKKKVLVAQVDLMTTPTKERLAEKLAKTIHDDIASTLFRAREAAIGVFRGLRITPRVTLDPDDASVSFGFDVGHRGAGHRRDAGAAARAAGRAGRRPEAAGRARAGRVPGGHGHRPPSASADARRLPAPARGRPRLPRQQAPHAAAHLQRSQRAVLAQREADGARRDPAGAVRASSSWSGSARHGESIDGEAVARILELTHGHPYATQEVCYAVWEETAARRTASLAEVERGLTGVLHSEHAHFSLLWDGAASGQRLLLQALAAEPGRPYTAAFRREHGLPAATNVQKALAALRRRELVATAKDGTVSIAEPFFAEWIARLGT